MTSTASRIPANKTIHEEFVSVWKDVMQVLSIEARDQLAQSVGYSNRNSPDKVARYPDEHRLSEDRCQPLLEAAYKRLESAAHPKYATALPQAAERDLSHDDLLSAAREDLIRGAGRISQYLGNGARTYERQPLQELWGRLTLIVAALGEAEPEDGEDS